MPFFHFHAFAFPSPTFGCSAARSGQRKRKSDSRHVAGGEEAAVKLIRRGNIDTSAHMSKVEREIEVLRVCCCVAVCFVVCDSLCSVPLTCSRWLSTFRL